jgi:uncharacterized protein YjbI with pentapeptide repeats
MIPYASAKSQGDKKFDIVLEKYRLRKASLIKKRETIKTLREKIDFFVEYRDHLFAEKAYSRLLKKIPTDLSALIGRAKLRYEIERYEEALADSQAALKIKSDDKDARRGRILSLVKLGRIKELTPSDNDFTGIEISGYKNTLTFASAKLAGAIFKNANLNTIDFSGADLRNADFSGAKFRLCNFTGADLTGANFENLQEAYEANFAGANLQQSSFKNAYIRYSNFKGANLNALDFSKAKFENNSFENTDLTTTNFQGATLLLTDFRGSLWKGQDLSGADLRGSDLRNTVLQNVNLSKTVIGEIVFANGTDLRGTDLSSANLTDIQWGTAYFDCHTSFPPSLNIGSIPLLPIWNKCEGNPPKTKIMGGFESNEGPWIIKIDGRDSQFSGLDFSKARLLNLNVQGSSFVNVNFDEAQLEKAYFHRVDFSNSSFENANLSHSRIKDVNFTDANLDGTNLIDACYDNKTVWPDGFDPSVAGAKVCK